MSGDLQVQVPVEGELGVEVPDTFHLTLASPMYLFGEVDQQSVNVVVTLFDSASNFIGRFDGPARGPELPRVTPLILPGTRLQAISTPHTGPRRSIPPWPILTGG